MTGMPLGEFDEGDKPISRHVHRWYAGEFTKVTSPAGDGTVHVHVDGPFAQVAGRVPDIPVGQG